MAASSSGTPFVARERELRRLDELVSAAGAGDPTLLIVGGDAGVGKTRLVTRAAEVAAAHGAVVVTGHCVDLGAVGIPYLPLIEALGALRGASSVVEEIEQQRPALARLLDVASERPDGTGARLQLLDGLASVLARAGAPGAPLVLIIEDAHWCDPSTLEVLRFLIARLRDEHLLVVVTYRADDLQRNHPFVPAAAELARHPRVSRLDLAPFTDDELQTFVAAVAGRPLVPGELDDVRRRSEGNAFFAEELVAAGPGVERIPLSLADVLRARVARLTADVQRLVRVASAAGRVVPERLLRAVAAGPVLRPEGVVASLDPVDASAHDDEVLRDAVGARVLYPEQGDRLAFRHALLAEAVYDDLLPGDRVALHRAYLAAIVADPSLGSAAVRAFHALRADDLPTTLVASRDAARDAADVLAPVEEHRHLEQALALWDGVPGAARLLGETRTALALAAAAASSRAGGLRRAVELTRSVIDGTPEAVDRARLEHVLAGYLCASDSTAEMFDRTAAALEVLRDDGPSRDRARTLAAHAQAALELDRPDACREHARLAVAEAREVGAVDVEVDALNTLAVLERGRASLSYRLLVEALEQARSVSDPEAELRCVFNMASNRLMAGRLEDASALAAQGLVHAHDTGLAWSMYGMMTLLVAETVRYMRGDLGLQVNVPLPGRFGSGLEAVELLAAVARGDEGTIERGRALRPAWDAEPQIATSAGASIAEALMWGADPESALDVLDEASACLASARGESYVGQVRLRALALEALAEVAAQAALAGSAPSALAEVAARGDRCLADCRLSAEAGAERRIAAGSDLDDVEPLSPEARAWLVRAAAEHARVQGLCGLGTNDPERWAATVQAFGFGHRYEVARSRWRWAEALVGAGDREGARRELTTAVEEADAMGARPLAEACRALARRARLGVGGVRVEQGSVLTDREAEVLRLVARGMSNRQIGERLFISGKTVSVHVSNVLAKLGASGRAQAVSIAHRRGLLMLDDMPT